MTEGKKYPSLTPLNGDRSASASGAISVSGGIFMVDREAEATGRPNTSNFNATSVDSALSPAAECPDNFSLGAYSLSRVSSPARSRTWIKSCFLMTESVFDIRVSVLGPVAQWNSSLALLDLSIPPFDHMQI